MFCQCQKMKSKQAKTICCWHLTMAASHPLPGRSLTPEAATDEMMPPVQNMIEITQHEALRSLLKNEELSDLTLHGSDGFLVFANRGLLASRSPVFYRMLFGQFKEASKKDIELAYDGAVLEAIVEYIYTDDVSTLHYEENDYDENPWDIALVRFLVNLLDAANYFALPKLRQKIEKTVVGKMSKDYNVAALFLASCAPYYDETKVLRDLALDYVREYPTILVDGEKEVVAMIHPLHVESILKDETLIMDERSCFLLVQSWANAEEGHHDKGTNIEKTRDRQNSSRKRIAAQMTNYLHLEQIDVRALCTTVSDSGLVTTEQLAEAYKKQSSRASKKLCTHPKNRRGLYVWKNSRTSIFNNHNDIKNGYTWLDILDCPILKSGVHQWSIEVLEGAQSLDLGVASTHWSIASHTRLGDQQGGWGYDCDGEACHAWGLDNRSRVFREGLPKCSRGSTVKFTLNLEGEGTLTASIDGNAPFELFTGMLEGHDDTDDGFVPAVSAEVNGCVEFLGFEDAA